MRKGIVVNLFLGLTIALLPLYTRLAAVDFSRTAKDNLLVVIMGFLCVFMGDKKREFPLIGWILSVLSLFFVVFNQSNVTSLYVIFHGLYICSGLFFLIRFYETFEHESLGLILDGMAFGALIQAVIVMTSAMGFDIYGESIGLLVGGKVNGPTFYPWGSSVGSLGNTNLLGSYLALTSFALLREKWIWLLPIPVWALVSSNSVMGVGSFGAGAFYYMNLKQNFISKKFLYVMAIFGMVGLFLVGVGGADSGRFEAWQNLFNVIDSRHLLVGMGPGWYPSANFTLFGNWIVQEHNEFLALFNIAGIVGIFGFAFILWKFLNRPDHNHIFSSILFAAFCNCYGHFALHQSTVAIIIIIAVAVCATEGKRYEFDLEW